MEVNRNALCILLFFCVIVWRLACLAYIKKRISSYYAMHGCLQGRQLVYTWVHNTPCCDHCFFFCCFFLMILCDYGILTIHGTLNCLEWCYPFGLQIKLSTVSVISGHFPHMVSIKQLKNAIMHKFSHISWKKLQISKSQWVRSRFYAYCWKLHTSMVKVKVIP